MSFIDRRQANKNWTVTNERGEVFSWETAQIAVLMDLRDELQKLNGLLNCMNFIRIPATLREIRANTAKRKRKKAAK